MKRSAPAKGEPRKGPGLPGLLEAIAARDDRGALAVLGSEPDLARARVDSDHLYEAIPHWAYGGDTALHLAACALRVRPVEVLLETGADARAINRRGATPLHYVCDPRPSWGEVRDPKTQGTIIDRLVASGAPVDLADQGGATALHRAVRAKSPEAVRRLLAQGADVGALLKKQGTTPLHLAVQSTGAGGTQGSGAEQLAIVALLLEHGAKPGAKDAKGKTPRDLARSPDVVAALGAKRRA